MMMSQTHDLTRWGGRNFKEMSNWFIAFQKNAYFAKDNDEALFNFKKGDRELIYAHGLIFRLGAKPIR